MWPTKIRFRLNHSVLALMAENLGRWDFTNHQLKYVVGQHIKLILLKTRDVTKPKLAPPLSWVANIVGHCDFTVHGPLSVNNTTWQICRTSIQSARVEHMTPFVLTIICSWQNGPNSSSSITILYFAIQMVTKPFLVLTLTQCFLEH